MKQTITIAGEEWELTDGVYPTGELPTHQYFPFRRVSKPEQKESERLWGQYEKEMWENTDEFKPKFAYVRDVLSRNKIFANYILARVREEQGK